MAIQEKSAVLVKKASNGDQIWVYPITLSENIIHNDEQLDELITEIVNNITALKSGTVFDTALSATSTKGVQNKTIYTALNNKVDKEDGKGLSTNDYTTAEKNKLQNIENNANNYTHPSYTQRSSGLYKITVDATGHVSQVTAVAKSDITALGIPAQDTTYSVATTDSNGLMSASDKTKLNGIASGAEVNQNAFSNILVGSTTIAADSKTDTLTLAAGNNVTLTPDASGDKITISATNTTYSVATSSSNGLMSATDKKKLDGIAENANNYTHPSYTNKASGLYKITVDVLGHVSAATAVTKSDITALGIPAQDTTYSTATTSTSGLMSAADKIKLNGIESGANKTVIDSALNSTSTNPVQNRVINSAINAVNTRLDNIIEGAPDAYDTLKEISDYISSHTTEYEALYALVGDKVTKEDGKGLSTNDYTTTEKNKLAGIATGAEVNQNAFSNILVGSTTIAADSKTDTVTFVAGNNVTLTPDASGDKITFSATNTTYSVATTSSNGLMSATDKKKLDGIAANANNYRHPSYTQRSSGLYKITVDATGHVSAVTGVAKSDITALGIPAQDTTYTVATTDSNGLMSASDKTKLNGIASGAEVNQNAFSNILVGSTTIAADSKTDTLTLVAGNNVKLTPDATGDKITISATNTTYSVATSSSNGLMSATDKKKLDGIAENANNYTHPSYTNKASGLYKITVDALGHVSAATAITKSDITALGIPAQDTTYSAATTSTTGLMSATDKKKLDGIESGANKTVIDSALNSTSTNPVQNKVINSAINAVNTRLDNIIEGAPDAYDTLKEISDYISSHTTEYEALYALVGDKVTKEDGKGLSTNDYTTTEKNKLAGIATGAEVNQNAFSNISVGSTTIAADSKTDTLTFVAGNNVTLTPDASGDKITFSATNTTYSVATTSSNGLMSAADKTKLNGIAKNANNYKHPSYTQRSSGLYKITVDATGHVSNVTAVSKSDITRLGIPAQDTTYTTATESVLGLTKLYGSTGSATDGTMTRTAITSALSGKANVRQLGNSEDLDDIIAPGFYSAGGSNKVANKPSDVDAFGVIVYKVASGYIRQDLISGNTNPGKRFTRYYDSTNWTGWIYLPTYATNPTSGQVIIAGANGAIKSSGYTIAKSVPSNAKFTDTTYSTATTSTSGLMSAADKKKLDAIDDNANNYKHPSYTQRSSGLYKITVDATGHVSAVTAVAKSDITALGIPAQDTTYTLSSFGITASATELNYVDGVTSNIQTQLNNKLSTTATAAAASKLATARNINGMSFDGTANRFNYGTCSTAAATAAKTVSCTGFTLATGAEITVKFTVTNSASSPTLNVNSTGAKPIYYNGAAISARYLKAKKTYTFRYNGTQYDLVGDIDTNTTYSLSSFGITATAAELNKLDGVTATATELNYVDGVTSNIQTQLNSKAASNHSHSNATTSTSGFMSGTDKKKLDGIAANANNYKHPSYTTRSTNMYRFAVDASGHVSSATAVTKANLEDLLGYSIAMDESVPSSVTEETYFFEIEEIETA